MPASQAMTTTCTRSRRPSFVRMRLDSFQSLAKAVQRLPELL